VKILALGDRDPAFVTHRELDAAFELMPAGVECSWTGTDTPQARDLESADGVWLLPGTPYRDDAAAYAAIEHCRVSGTPFLGTCGGFQYACVGLARSLAGIEGAAHAESDPDTGQLVIVPLRCSLYGEHRQVEPVPGTLLARICGDQPFAGFHWCGYGLDPGAEAQLQAAGVVLSARAQDAGVEAIELPGHPFFVATAFQPQAGTSESGTLHPLITALLTAASVRTSSRQRSFPANNAWPGRDRRP
jgi:CTP synthase (UTP-ammonia lyase)